MSREIKFRAFSGISMVESDEFTIDGDTGAVRLTSYSSYGEPTELMDSWTLMQYTGLKDKNGVEIYEGDIVEHKNGWTGVIVFNQEDCAFISENVRDRKDTAWLAPDIQAVIGNIHENPELLKP